MIAWTTHKSQITLKRKLALKMNKIRSKFLISFAYSWVKLTCFYFALRQHISSIILKKSAIVSTMKQYPNTTMYVPSRYLPSLAVLGARMQMVLHEITKNRVTRIVKARRHLIRMLYFSLRWGYILKLTSIAISTITRTCERPTPILSVIGIMMNQTW